MYLLLNIFAAICRLCVQYVYLPLIKRELKEIKEMWNNHSIRRQKLGDTIPGIPDVLFHNPEIVGMNIFTCNFWGVISIFRNSINITLNETDVLYGLYTKFNLLIMNKIHKRVYNLVNEFSIKMLYNTNLNNTEVSLQATGFVSILPLQIWTQNLCLE